MKVDTFAKLSDTGFKVEAPCKAWLTVQGRSRQGSDGGKCRLWGPLLCVSRKTVLCLTSPSGDSGWETGTQ